MKNEGKVTVFLTLIISALLLIGVTAIKANEIYVAKAKTAMSVRTSMSNVKADYNSYIFEKYHILLFDKNYYGRGEAYLEELVKDSLQENLGDEYEVDEVVSKNHTLIIDNECEEFKRQINEYFVYAQIENVADIIVDKTSGKDGGFIEDPESLIRKSDSETEEERPGNQTNGQPGDNSASVKVSDPRDIFSNMTDLGLLNLLVPNDLEISSAKIDIGKVPSRQYTGLVADIFEVNNSFTSRRKLSSDLNSHNKWGQAVIDAGASISYANAVFNSAILTVNEETVFDFELEYIICGNDSDYLNLKETVNKITAIRMAINYSYLVGDASKMSQVSALSLPISLMTFIPEPFVKYLLAGCWAYAEALLDVRSLLHGKKVAFTKNAMTWKSDISNIMECFDETMKDDEKGMDYEDYLMILMAVDINDSYYRMLDVMELNAKQSEPEFEIENASVGFEIDATVTFRGVEFSVSESSKY